MTLHRTKSGNRAPTRRADMRISPNVQLPEWLGTGAICPVVAGADGRIFAIGGVDPRFLLNVVEIYDPRTNAWTTGAPMPTGVNGMAAGRRPGWQDLCIRC